MKFSRWWGVLLLSALVGAGCGGSSGGGADTSASTGAATTDATGTATATTATTTASTEKQLRLTIAAGKVSGDTDATVNKGDAVTLTIQSDAAEIVHVHGYDKEVEVEAGVPAKITFVADIAGRFEVEGHRSNRKLMQLTVE